MSLADVGELDLEGIRVIFDITSFEGIRFSFLFHPARTDWGETGLYIEFSRDRESYGESVRFGRFFCFDTHENDDKIVQRLANLAGIQEFFRQELEKWYNIAPDEKSVDGHGYKIISKKEV